MLIASLVLSLASLTPSVTTSEYLFLAPPPNDPPVQYPCAIPNPDILYVPFEGTGECYLLYRLGVAADTIAYYAWIEDHCAGGDCACYAEGWARFLANVSIHEDGLMDCILSNN